ncbi:MAG: right-handed parallel beta-helix repeat-containing protein [Planctomycetota bacterium]|nr:right-handed parallel beta-helix repeat-containing protein [Planctomycetota bacterium]
MNTIMKSLMCVALLLAPTAVLHAADIHVAPGGKDANPGTQTAPLRTIQRGANLAQPGDVITVHAGVYRERISPPRGGESDAKRIVYQAAPGEKVEIKGSEIVKNWVKVRDDTWKATIPNGFFGKFNPYSDLIHGDWFDPAGRTNHTGAVYLNGDWLRETPRLDDVMKPAGDTLLWHAQVDDANTTIRAQFKGINPNEQLVEINVRRTVFYPEKPGMNYITVRGFTMCHAATPWSPPTAEQIGLVGTHWSKGWIIENNVISHSTCVGVTLGKYGDQWDNKGESNDGYIRTIKLARENGWSRDNIGRHIVRNNTISHCEQSGIVGSLGAVFSTVAGNTIHDIHVRGLFGGAEMAGIKFHAAIDVTISGNHIYRTCRGIWLDWMGQGTRITRNLFHDNSQDLFFEVNHGPILVDNNILLSRVKLLSNSQGVAFVHNLMVEGMGVVDQSGNQTPLHKPHSTEFAKMHGHPSGDDRYYNNLVEHGDLSEYDAAKLPVWMSGNVFLKGAKPSKHEAEPLLKPDFDPALKLVEKSDGLCLELAFDKAWIAERTRKLVTTELLGKAVIPDQAYENPDGTPLGIDTDYFGKKRNENNPFPGPFEISEGGKQVLKVWETKESSR